VLEAFLADQGTSTRRIIIDTLAAIDVARCMTNAGLTVGDRAALDSRLLGCGRYRTREPGTKTGTSAS
jgi:hypothetical protein